jgi:hypothetical protein
MASHWRSLTGRTGKRELDLTSHLVPYSITEQTDPDAVYQGRATDAAYQGLATDATGVGPIGEIMPVT